MNDFNDITNSFPDHVKSANDATKPGAYAKNVGSIKAGTLILNRYRVLSVLGQGGMGIVYRCLDETAGIEIALKMLPPELSCNSFEMEDIKYNFQLVAKLIHQNIAVAKNLEKDDSNGNYYLIMEYCPGEDLRRWIRRKSSNQGIRLEDVLPVIKQIAEALDYAHKQKVVHRDIKPGNIMINFDGEIKLLDFGLAASIRSSMTHISMEHHGISGTAVYMAPEQWHGRVQGAAADQYALAVMTYEMLAGHLPFASTDTTVLREAVLNDTPEKITGISQAAMAAVMRAMSKDAAERFKSCREFVAALTGKQDKIHKTIFKGSFYSRFFAAVILLATVSGAVWYYFFKHTMKEQTPNEEITAIETATVQVAKKNPVQKKINAILKEIRDLQKSESENKKVEICKKIIEILRMLPVEDFEMKSMIDYQIAKLDRLCTLIPENVIAYSEIREDTLTALNTIFEVNSNDAETMSIAADIIPRYHWENINLKKTLLKRGVLSESGMYSEFIQLCEEILKWKPNDQEAKKLLVESHIYSAEYYFNLLEKGAMNKSAAMKNAAEHIVKARKIDPDNPKLIELEKKYDTFKRK